MNTLNDLKKNGIIIKDYHKIYAKRHNLNPQSVASIEWCDLAAQLEFLVGIGHLSVLEARKRFVKEYPKSNCTAWNNKQSVINLIRPYEDSIRNLDNLNQKEIQYVSEN